MQSSVEITVIIPAVPEPNTPAFIQLCNTLSALAGARETSRVKLVTFGPDSGTALAPVARELGPESANTPIDVIELTSTNDDLRDDLVNRVRGNGDRPSPLVWIADITNPIAGEAARTLHESFRTIIGEVYARSPLPDVANIADIATGRSPGTVVIDPNVPLDVPHKVVDATKEAVAREPPAFARARGFFSGIRPHLCRPGNRRSGG